MTGQVKKSIYFFILKMMAGGILLLVLYALMITPDPDPEMLVWVFAGGSGFSVALVAIHFYLIARGLKRIESFLSLDVGSGQEILTLAINFPKVHASIGLAVWVVSGAVGVLFSLIPGRGSFATYDMTLLSLGLMVVAGIIWIMNVFGIKNRMEPVIESIVKKAPCSIDEVRKGLSFNPITRHLVTTLMILLFSSLLIATVSSYRRAGFTLQNWLGERVSMRAKGIASGLTSFDLTDPSQLKIALAMLEPRSVQIETVMLIPNPETKTHEFFARFLDNESMSIFLIREDRPSFDLLSETEMVGAETLLKRIRKAPADNREKGGYLFDNFSEKILSFQPVIFGDKPEQKFWLIAGYDWESYKSELDGLLFMALGVFLVFGMVTTMVAVSLARHITNPLQVLTVATGKLAEGALDQEVCYSSNDELGELAISFRHMSLSLQGMVASMNQAVASAEGAIDRIGRVSNNVNEGVATQERAIEDTFLAMEEITRSARGIASSVETLSEATRQSAESVNEMSGTMNSVFGSVEVLDGLIGETGGSIREMIVAIKQVSENAESLTTVAADTAAAMEQIDQGIEVVRKNTVHTTEISKQVIEQAEAGAMAVEKSVEGNQEIERVIRHAQEVITRLGQRARDVGKILEVIQDIATETNLLSLNAAILAAQAGDSGRGFSVVATEIKELSERTEVSTKEIHKLIMDVQGEAEAAVKAIGEGARSGAEGVALSEEAQHALELIVKISRTANQQVAEVAAITADQAEASRKVNQAMSQISIMTQEISSATTQQARGGAFILEAAQRMQEASSLVRNATEEQKERAHGVSMAIEQISAMLDGINIAQQEQKISSQQVIGLINDGVRTISRQSLESTQEMNLVVTELGVEAGKLRNIVSRFQLPS